jgi:hypothetical protein
MIRIFRNFASRLRRITAPAAATHAHDPTHADVPGTRGWERLTSFLTPKPVSDARGVRERELVSEEARILVTLVGHDGERLVRCVIEHRLSDQHTDTESALLSLAMAVALGSEATREAALAALPMVAETEFERFRWGVFLRALSPEAREGSLVVS